jgi:hypothetical protein
MHPGYFQSATMKKLFLLGVFALLAVGAQAQRLKPCNIYGSVYFVKDKFQADFSVYIEETESFADLVVFREDNALYADKSGVWFIANKIGLADYRVYIETIKGRANFSIHYTDNRSFAGCN